MRRHRAFAAAALAALAVPAGASGASLHLGDRGLRPGAHGHDVRVLQDLLTRDGFVTTIDGRFGPSTRTAVLAFQRAAGLTASGVVGRLTVAALRAGPPVAAATTPAPPATAIAPSLTPAATIDAAGLAHAPIGAPPAVVAAVDAGNAIATLPYRWGGGHRSFTDTGYDCSGSVSYALHGAGLLDVTETSGELAHWGEPGPGTWMTVYANADHTFLVIAGIRFDTSGQSAAGTRWQPAARSLAGFVARHPAGL
jgi:peptidoglycan hydrolase-like protein with peptidoglycan-binding domain